MIASSARKAPRSVFPGWISSVKHKILGPGKPRVQAKVENASGQEISGLKAHGIVVKTPEEARAQQEIRNAMKDATVVLSQFVDAVVAKKAMNVLDVNSDVTGAFLPITQRKTDLLDPFAELCGVSLMRLLPKLPSEHLQTLSSGLDTWKKDRQDSLDSPKDVPVIHQLEISVKAELLYRALFGPQLPMDMLSDEALVERQALASQLMTLAKSDFPSSTRLPGTRYSLDQLEHIEGRASHALEERAKARVKAARLVKSMQKDLKTDPNTIQNLSIHRLRELHAALELHVGHSGHEKDVKLARLQTSVSQRLDEEEKPIIQALQRQVVAGPFSKLPDHELMILKYRIQAVARPPTLLVRAMASISTQIDLRKVEAKQDFQDAFRETLRAEDPAQVLDLLLRSTVKAMTAKRRMDLLGERVDSMALTGWINEVLDAELKSGHSDGRRLGALLERLQNGDGQMVLNALDRKFGAGLKSEREYLITLKAALDIALWERGASLPRRSKKVKHLTPEVRAMLMRHLHVASRLNKETGAREFVHIGAEIRAAKSELEQSLGLKFDGSNTKRVAGLVSHVSLLASVAVEPQDWSDLQAAIQVLQQGVKDKAVALEIAALAKLVKAGSEQVRQT